MRLLTLGKVGGGGKFAIFGGGGKLAKVGGGGKLAKVGGGGKLAIFGSVGGGGRRAIFGRVGGGDKPPTAILRVGRFPPVLTVVGLLLKFSCAYNKAFAFFMPSGLPLIYYFGFEGAYLGTFCLNKLASRFFLAN
jgi:hypothetical protein